MVAKINNLAADTPWQVAGLNEITPTGHAPAFFPNPRHDRGLYEVDLALQQAAQWEAHEQRRDVEFRDRLLVRAMGSTDGRSWWFTGRHTALTDITTWLHHPDPTHPLLAVTADPGSGKTAVLGVIAALTHPEYHRTVPLETLRLPKYSVPRVGAVDVVIYAQKLTLDQVRDGIAAAAKLTAATVGELLDGLTGRHRPFTVLLDGLDEATDADQLTRQLLRPLITHAAGRVRLLIGTRPYLLPSLGTARENEIDLDAARYADLEALTTYTVHGLLDAAPDSVYLHQDPTVLRAVADAVAEQAAPSFLVARVVAATLATDPTIPDPSDPVWRHNLPRLPGEAMRHDLDSRLGTDARKARDMLRPLALAQGQGLPWEDVWAALASALAEADYNDHDLMWLRRTAGSYVVEAVENGRSAYRLYHQALAEHLLEGWEIRAAHAVFVRTLTGRVTRTSQGYRAWADAHPYTCHYLAMHAAHAGLVDELVTDLDYLVHAEPAPLLDVLDTVTTETALLHRAIYRCSAHVHRSMPPRRRRGILAIDAARFGAPVQQSQLNRGQDWQVSWATGGQIDYALRSTLSGHIGMVSAVACTTISNRPAAVTASGTAMRVWDLRTGTELAVLTGHTRTVNAVACTSIHGRPVAVSGSSDATVRVWDLITGTQQSVLAGHTEPVRAVACTEINGQPIAVTGGRDGAVLVWDLTTGVGLGQLGYIRTVEALACTSIDGRPVAIGGGSVGWVRVWDLITGAQLTEFIGHVGMVDAVACTSIDGRSVAVTGGSGGMANVWDLMSGSLHSALIGHSGAVWAVACTTIDGRPVAVTGGSDHTVRVWDLISRTQRTVLIGHLGAVDAVACTYIDGRPVAVAGSRESGARVWDLTTTTRRAKRMGHIDMINVVACTTVDGRVLAVTGSSDGTARVWDVTTGTEGPVLTGHDRAVNAAALTIIDGRPVAVTGGDDGAAIAWDLTTDPPRAELVGGGLGPAVRAVACISIGDHAIALTGGDDGILRVWDLTTDTEPARFAAHRGGITALACTSIDNQTIAVTGGDDGTAIVWNLTAGTRGAFLAGGTGRVNSIACTEIGDQAIAIVGYSDATVRLWDLSARTPEPSTKTDPWGHPPAHQPINVPDPHPVWTGPVTCTNLDGRPVAIWVSEERRIRLWELATMTEIAAIDFPSPPQTMTCSDGMLVIGFGHDLAALKWNATNTFRGSAVSR
ncbi:WD40 repeat domain-containing protein [Nocardia takedensis]|uniref:WD40 repeat domain-containing protein n=1 Tax=Nocardia takedensis TaxID=259390 RepID=UPI001FE20DD7|nr:WD40 repeat domain-containing protein [Nocardia takedensis]